MFFFHYHSSFASISSVLVLFSQCVDSSHHLAQAFLSQENKTRDGLASCHCVVFFLHRLVAVVKDKRKKKKRQTTVVQQQSASRVQLTSLSAAKERKHGKRRQLPARRTKQTRTRAHAESDDSSGKDSRGGGQLVRWRGRCVQPTDDVSSEDESTDQHVHKNKWSKLKRNDSGHKTFPTSSPSQAPRALG